MTNNAPPKGMLSLYDNLTDPKAPSPATVSSAPVSYIQGDGAARDATAAKKSVDPALRFQPIRRPPVKQPKPKTSFTKPFPKPAADPSSTAPPPAAAPPKSNLAAWAVTEEDEWRYGTGEKRQRGGRKKKKKRQDFQAETNWDELYDPARPTNLEEYLRSDERIDEVREWKALLYRHRRRKDESDISDEEDELRPSMSNQFAPPASYGSVPPPPQSPPAAPPPEQSAEDAYARRLALSQPQKQPAPPPPPELNTLPPPPPTDSATISRAPVRYALPEEATSASPPQAHHDEEPDERRSNRPGQAGFAHRLMAKYGWTKGTGLGADESGIVNPLRVQVEKRRRKADADGGGWADPANKGKIVGGTKRKTDKTAEGSKFGSMSEVIVLRNMLENMPDLEGEIENGLGQEIGEECGEKYGRVERLYFDHHNRQVFIQFTNQVSALRAVNELDGRVFNGNAIEPRFYDTERFGRGVYDAD